MVTAPLSTWFDAPPGCVVVDGDGFGVGFGFASGLGVGLGDLVLVDEVLDFVPVDPEEVDDADRLKLADFSTPSQTLAPLGLLSISEPEVMLTFAVPLANTLKLTDATVCVPLYVDADAHCTLTEPPPPELLPQSEKTPVEFPVHWSKEAL